MSKHICTEGLYTIEMAQSALEALQNLCDQGEHLDQVSGFGMYSLIGFIASGVKDAVEQQEEAITKAQRAFDQQSKRLQEAQDRLWSARQKRREVEAMRLFQQEIREGRQDTSAGRIFAKVMKESEAERAFDAEVKQLLGEGSQAA